MRTLKTVSVLLLIITIRLSAQFSLGSFLNESADQSIETVKEKLAGKNYELTNNGDLKRIQYFEWIDPVSIKVSYSFNKEGMISGKGLVNAKVSEDEAKKFLDLAKADLIQLYGNHYSTNTLFGITSLSWKLADGTFIILSCETDKTRLMIVSKKLKLSNL